MMATPTTMAETTATTVRATLALYTGRAAIADTARLGDDLRLDSLDMVELTMLLEEDLHCDLRPIERELSATTTVAELITLCQRAALPAPTTISETTARSDDHG